MSKIEITNVFPPLPNRSMWSGTAGVRERKRCSV